MPLRYTQPTEGLARELREVARDAAALQEVLTRGLNFPLPSDFPRDQLIEIARSLSQLPVGTAEGSRAALEYARSRLPAIRREHMLSEELNASTGDADNAPPVIRGELIDERLRHLIASVTTALDEYRRLVGGDPPEEDKPATDVTAPRGIVQRTVARSLLLEADLAAASRTVAETTNATSRSADDLKRQINDSQNLSRLARAELRMRKVVVRWFRRTVEALREYPSLIRTTANGLKVGADIVEIFAERWHEFQHNEMKLLFKEFRKFCDALIKVAGRLEKQTSGYPIGGPRDAIPDAGVGAERSILLVDDDEALRETLSDQLAVDGQFTVTEADTISEAEDRLAAKDAHFDAVILEVGLPDGDGRDLCMRLRKQGRTIPIILTGSDAETDMVRGLDMGANDYISKPFRLVELLARLRAHLRVFENSDVRKPTIRRGRRVGV